MTSLHWLDYVILAAFLIASLGIGFYHSMTGGRQRTTEEFIMANRRLGVLPTAISLLMSYKSAITVLGTTVEMYQFGSMFCVGSVVAEILARLLTERLVIPWIYPLKLVSINDYLELRYESKAIRRLGTVIGLLDGIVYMGIATFAPSIALESATGLPLAVSIPLMAFVCIAYTTLGGMRAVIWTDVFQFLVFICGLIAILVKGVLTVGGYQKVWAISDDEGRLELFNWSFNPTVRHTAWGFIVGHTMNLARLYGLSQASVQRFSATESMSKARIVLLLNIPCVCLMYFLTCSIGLTIFAYYSTKKCDPIVNKDVTNANQLVSLFVTTLFSSAPGFTGLFLATLYGGALSSFSSSLSGAAANCWEDVFKPIVVGMKENRKAVVNRILVVIIGVIATGMAFLVSFLPGPITQIVGTYLSAVYGPLYGVFILGGLSKYANWQGAIVGGVGSLCINIWLNAGALTLQRPLPTLPPTSTDGCQSLISADNSTWLISTPSNNNVSSLFSYHDNTTVAVSSSELVGIENLYGISYLWYSLLSIVNVLVIGMIVSLIFRNREAESRVKKELLIPFRQVFSWTTTSSTWTPRDNLLAVDTDDCVKDTNVDCIQ